MRNQLIRSMTLLLASLFLVPLIPSTPAEAGCYTRSVCKRYPRGQHCRRTRYCRRKEVCRYRRGKRVCTYRKSCYSGAKICRSRRTVTRCRRVRICR